MALYWFLILNLMKLCDVLLVKSEFIFFVLCEFDEIVAVWIVVIACCVKSYLTIMEPRATCYDTSLKK
jgi:hypothetical protein